MGVGEAHTHIYPFSLLVDAFFQLTHLYYLYESFEKENSFADGMLYMGKYFFQHPPYHTSRFSHLHENSHSCSAIKKDRTT